MSNVYLPFSKPKILNFLFTNMLLLKVKLCCTWKTTETKYFIYISSEGNILEFLARFETNWEAIYWIFSNNSTIRTKMFPFLPAISREGSVSSTNVTLILFMSDMFKVQLEFQKYNDWNEWVLTGCTLYSLPLTLHFCSLLTSDCAIFPHFLS